MYIQAKHCSKKLFYNSLLGTTNRGRKFNTTGEKADEIMRETSWHFSKKITVHRERNKQYIRLC